MRSVVVTPHLIYTHLLSVAPPRPWGIISIRRGKVQLKVVGTDYPVRFSGLTLWENRGEGLFHVHSASPHPSEIDWGSAGKTSDLGLRFWIFSPIGAVQYYIQDERPVCRFYSPHRVLGIFLEVILAMDLRQGNGDSEPSPDNSASNAIVDWDSLPSLPNGK